jgi:hypothetical protein
LLIVSPLPRQNSLERPRLTADREAFCIESAGYKQKHYKNASSCFIYDCRFGTGKDRDFD